MAFEGADDYVPIPIILPSSAPLPNETYTMTITGELEIDGVPVNFPVLEYDGEVNDRPRFSSGDYVLAYEPGNWLLTTKLDFTDYWFGAGDDFTPENVTDWLASGNATGTPVITSSRRIAETIGQLCRHGDTAPYRWFIAESAAGGAPIWREIDESTVENFTVTGILTADQFLGGSATFSGAVTASNLSGTNTGDQDLSGLVAKSDYTPAHSILAQQSGTGSPTAVTLGNNTILGRMSGGGSNIAGLSASDARTVMGLGTLATVNGGTGVADFLASPTSANLAAAVTGETGSGSLVFANSPTIVTPTINQINAGSGQCLVTGTGASGILQLRASTTGGFSSCDLQNTAGTQVGGFGYGGTTAGAYADQCYFYGTNRVLVLASQITQRHFIIDLSGRIGIGNGISSVNAAAQLQVDSTTRGFLPPRMTTAERNAITSVPAGLMIYNTSTNKLNFFNGTAWEAVTSA
jgi:hypothetical protein